MRFRMRGYSLPDGRCPVDEFLDKHKQDDFGSYAVLVAGIRKLRDRKNHKDPLSKPVGDELFEIRNIHSGARILYCFRPKQLIVLLLGLIKKEDKLPPGAKAQALRYRADYLERCTDNEEEIDEEF